ncbi:MAG TPA: PEPxxWA-CTERM sorting domain-containing protein [Caulobacteraceae bacterium]|jgi:hypothetical protein
MKTRAGIFALAAAVAIAGAAGASTVTVSLGQSAQNFTLYGQGAYAPGLGSFTVGQGAGSTAAGVSTFILSGAITGGSAGYNSGTYEFITTYNGADSPTAGPNAPQARSNPSFPNEFFYSHFDPSTDMVLELFGTPTGNHIIDLVTNGVFDGPGFGFSFVTASCTGVDVCDQNTVGLTPGATIGGPVDISASFAAVPEPATWAIMLAGFAGLGAALRRRRSAYA